MTNQPEKKLTADLKVDVKEARKNERLKQLAFEVRLSKLAHFKYLTNKIMKESNGTITRG